MVHNWTLSDTQSPAAAFKWIGLGNGVARSHGVDNVGSVEESKYSACLHTNKTKKVTQIYCSYSNILYSFTKTLDNAGDYIT